MVSLKSKMTKTIWAGKGLNRQRHLPPSRVTGVQFPRFTQ